LTSDLRDYLREKQTQVEAYLDGLLRPCAGCPPALLEAMRYSVLAPGKRLRPALVLMAAETSATGGLAGSDPLPAAGAVELVHVYSLIHDDLPAMDDDDLRRGLPTCHKKFGEALAILAGDALLTMAFQVLAESYPPATAAGCCRELARGAGAAGMVGGQVDDLAWEKSSASFSREPKASAPAASTLADLENLHARKTGALFRACLRLGVLTAQGDRPQGPDPKLVDRLDAYGRCFGLAFQITDDLLDVEGDAAQTGKRVQKDAAHGKLTYPRLLGRAESRRRAERLYQQAREYLAPLGAAADRLMDLFRFILERDR
jgi:geranylgeranyl diphosphate synthase type II